MTHASSMITIHAPADAIWQVISDFGAACKYLVMVDDCSVVGQGIGALRTLTSSDGTSRSSSASKRWTQPPAG